MPCWNCFQFHPVFCVWFHIAVHSMLSTEPQQTAIQAQQRNPSWDILLCSPTNFYGFGQHVERTIQSHMKICMTQAKKSDNMLANSTRKFPSLGAKSHMDGWRISAFLGSKVRHWAIFQHAMRCKLIRCQLWVSSDEPRPCACSGNLNQIN